MDKLIRLSQRPFWFMRTEGIAGQMKKEEGAVGGRKKIFLPHLLPPLSKHVSPNTLGHSVVLIQGFLGSPIQDGGREFSALTRLLCRLGGWVLYFTGGSSGITRVTSVLFPSHLLQAGTLGLPNCMNVTEYKEQLFAQQYRHGIVTVSFTKPSTWVIVTPLMQKSVMLCGQ